MLASHARATECDVEGVLVAPDPASATASWGMEALLAIVSVPESVPAAWGSKLTLKVNDWPGSSVVLEAEPMRLNPVPPTEIIEMLAFEFPIFLMVACSVSAVPTVTLPKLRAAGLEVSVTTEAWAIALQESCAGEPTALLAILMAPLAAPADVSFNDAVKFALCPAAIFRGVVIPETPMPEPVALTLEIVNGESPEFASRIVWVVVAPVGTSPKLTDDGVRVSCGDEAAVAVALQPTASGEFAALLIMVNVPEAFPAAVGLNVALRLALAPAARLTGNKRPDREIPEPEADTAEIVMLDDPEFVS